MTAGVSLVIGFLVGFLFGVLLLLFFGLWSHHRQLGIQAQRSKAWAAAHVPKPAKTAPPKPGPEKRVN